MTTKIKEVEEPKFRDPSELPPESLIDPDYHLKQLMQSNGEHPITCSKCHHCR